MHVDCRGLTRDEVLAEADASLDLMFADHRRGCAADLRRTGATKEELDALREEARRRGRGAAPGGARPDPQHGRALISGARSRRSSWWVGARRWALPTYMLARVRFHRRAHLPIVLASGLIDKPIVVPWWHGRPLRLVQ